MVKSYSYARGPYMRPSANSALRVRYPVRRRPVRLRLGLSKSARPRMGARVRTSAPTMTRQRQRKARGGVHKIGQNATAKYTRMGNSYNWRLWQSRKRTLAVRWFEFSSATTVDSYKASQGIYMLPSVLNRAHLKALSDKASTGNTTSKVFVGGGTTVIHIKNQTNIVAKCKLYEIYTRRTALGTGSDSPLSCWYGWCTDQGLASFTTETVTLNGAHRVDETPFCSDVGYYYKIGKVTTLHLEPGMQHNHTIKHRWHKNLRREAWEEADATTQPSIGGWTRHFMVVWYSTLVHDTNVAPVAATGVKEDAGEVSVASVRLDIVTSHKFEYMIDTTCVSALDEEVNYPYKLGILDEDHMGENQDADMDATRA